MQPNEVMEWDKMQQHIDTVQLATESVTIIDEYKIRKVYNEITIKIHDEPRMTYTWVSDKNSKIPLKVKTFMVDE